MAFTLKINARDLSAYVRTQHEEGLDPIFGERIEPQFGGSLALGEGQSWTRDATQNKQMKVPLLLEAASTDALNQLVRDINGDLVPGSQVEFNSGSATNSTFFELERGRLDVQYEFFIIANNSMRATLTLWTRPHGHTGTARTIASLTATTGPQSFPATGLIGDVDILGDLEVRVGSAAASAGRLIAYGVHESASFQPLHPGPSMGDRAASSIGSVGASGAIGSMYAAIPISPTTASGYLFRDYLSPPAAHQGRHRVLGIIRSGLYPANAMTLYAKDRFGAVMGPTIIASQNDQTKWMVADLGEINVPVRASGMDDVPTQYTELWGGGASGASIIASPAFHLNEVVYVPLDQSPGLLRTAGAGGAALLYSDSYARMTKPHFLTENSTFSRADGPGAVDWAQVASAAHQIGVAGLGIPDTVVGLMAQFNVPQNQASAGASALVSLASGVQNADLRAKLAFLNQASLYASGAEVYLWSKAQVPSGAPIASAQRVGVRLVLGPSANRSLSILSGLSASVVHASTTLNNVAGVPTGLGSAIEMGQRLQLCIQHLGPTAQAWVATEGGLSGAALLVTNHANIGAIQGNPVVGLTVGGTGVASLPQYIDDVYVYSLSGSAPDAAPRETFRFEAFPEARAYRGNASAFQADVTANFRGMPMYLPPVGSPGASGPARVVVMQGEIDNFLGNDIIDISLAGVERFTYLR